MEASGATPRTAPAEGAEWLRILGGVAFAVGATILFIRKSGAIEADWADFPLLLVAGIPCVLLYGLGVRDRRGREIERWRATLLVLGVVLAPLALEQLRETLGLSQASSFWQFVVFAGVAAMAAYAAFVVGAAYQALLAGLAGIAAWLFLWDWIASPGVNGFRWLLILLGLGYLGAALVLRAGNRPQGDELVTAAGIVGLLVGFIGVSQAAAQAVVGAALNLPGGTHGQGFFWDLVLLLVSLSSVGYAAMARVRGPAYVGFLGLVAFAGLLGLELGDLAEGKVPDGSLVGWPLVLLLLGGAALGAGVAAERRRTYRPQTDRLQPIAEPRPSASRVGSAARSPIAR